MQNGIYFSLHFNAAMFDFLFQNTSLNYKQRAWLKKRTTNNNTPTKVCLKADRPIISMFNSIHSNRIKMHIGLDGLITNE